MTVQNIHFLILFLSFFLTTGRSYCVCIIQHGGGVRCKLAGCNRVAIGKVQLCRAHGGGARPKNTLGPFSNTSREVMLPLESSVGAGSIQGTFCVPIIEPIIDGFGHLNQQQGPSVGADLASI